MRTETFNANHGFRFTRLDDASVVIELVLPPCPPDYPEERVVRSGCLTDAEWASVVAHMTEAGGTPAIYAAAYTLHARAS